MYSKSDSVVQQRLVQVEVIERRVEQSKEYLETEQEQGLITKELLCLVSPEEQENARKLLARLEECHTHKYNMTLLEVICSSEFEMLE